MGETSYQIERHINEKRDDLGDNLDELEEKLRNAMDWRAKVQTRPGMMIALAFGGGILLSAVLPGFSRGASGAARPNETWDALKSALLAVTATKVGGFVDGVLPGFSQEFTQARSVRRTPQRNS